MQAYRSYSLALIAGLLAAAPSLGRLPADAQEKQAVIGQPASVVVEPANITLSGPRAMQQVVVTGNYPDGTVRDLTHLAELSVEGQGVVSLQAGGFLKPVADGVTSLIVKAGPQTAKVPVVVKDFGKPQPISFRNDMIAALNVGGCNMGACHGTPSGKNGFRLSLRGYDPAADFLQLTRDALGRRTDRLEPEASMLLQKALGGIPHEGGTRFQKDSVAADVFRKWMSEGLQDDLPTTPTLKKIEIKPGSRILKTPARWQQVAVLATFSDGSVKDITRLTVFSSSDTAVADVNVNGLVEFNLSGEVAILCRYLDQLETVRLTYLEPREGFVWKAPAENNYIDKFVFAKLKMMSIEPSGLCSDQEFVRRAYMDVCGVLPNADEVKKFLDDKAADKRAKLIDSLLDRPEYADYWTLKWADVLRSNRKTIQVKGVYGYQQWLRGHIYDNNGIDQIVRELITANGNTYANPPANYYRIARDPQNLAESTAQLFFGIRMQCAKCHNHPFERWTQDDYYSFAAFFARVKQRKAPAAPGSAGKEGEVAEVIYSERSGEVQQPRTKQNMPPKFMGGAVPAIADGKSRLEVLADWLTASENPFFAKSVSNRIWYHLMGRGIVEPVDDFRDSNPSANDELLAAMAKDFADHKFDMKYLIRTIMNSRTYQLSSQTNDFNADDSKYFSHAVTKLHSAETLLDAICFVTAVPEKFPGVPLGTRAVQLPDGEVNHPFLKTFGQPGRELPCECEREGDSNLAQALQLINGPTVNEKMRDPKNRIGLLLGKKATDLETINELYLTVLSRLPSAEETKAVQEHVAKSTAAAQPGNEDMRRKAWEDVLWALINSKEFLFRH